MDQSLNAIPTIAEVERIAALSDALLRNLQITQCYYELSQAIAARTGAQANWCSFAAWASRQAGQSIRKEDLRRSLEDRLLSAAQVKEALQEVIGLARRGSDTLQRDPFTLRRALGDALGLPLVVDRISATIAQGNQKVFAEIGLEFARFAESCLGNQPADPARLSAFCQDLRPGEPPEGQIYLRQAFQNLYAAVHEPDETRRAEALFYANLLIGAHEQTRLQPEIQAALDAPLAGAVRFMIRLARGLFPGSETSLLAWLALRRLAGRPSSLEVAAGELYQRSQGVVRQALTELLMTLEVPGARLPLGSDLTGTLPAVLAHPTNPDLLAFLAAVMPAGAGLEGSGTLDWANLPDRLHFIAALFRLHHQTAALFDPPFLPDQVAAFKAGRRPTGRL